MKPIGYSEKLPAPQYGESDAGNMSNYDPNLGLGGKAGYEKATTAHAATIIGHLKGVGMTPQSPGAKNVADGIHKAAMDRLFNPQPAMGNAASTAPTSQGTSTGFMVPR